MHVATAVLRSSSSLAPCRKTRRQTSHGFTAMSSPAASAAAHRSCALRDRSPASIFPIDFIYPTTPPEVRSLCLVPAISAGSLSRDL